MFSIAAGSESAISQNLAYQGRRRGRKAVKRSYRPKSELERDPAAANDPKFLKLLDLPPSSFIPVD
jgi:hypothetical protein